MKQQNNNVTRKKRTHFQQAAISLSCLAIMAFVMVWTVNSALAGKNMAVSAGSEQSSSQTDSSENKPDNSSSSSKDKDESSAKDTSGNEKDDSSKEDSSEDDSSKEDSSEGDSSEDAKPDAKKDDFADAVFIGDSRTVGLGMNTDRPKATFYASIGLNVSLVGTEKVITLDDGSSGTIYDALKQKQFKRVYIMFGINELGWPYPDVFKEEYEQVINKIKEIQPDATIYVQSILPVSSLALSTNAIFTNDNVNTFNEYVKQAAADTGAVYLDVASCFKDENGELPMEASTDGIHLIREYCMKWMDYLAENS
ncbi:MAG: GDSL-type esterase/lipase family protein [Oscillospiraceae bacterium]